MHDRAERAVAVVFVLQTYREFAHPLSQPRPQPLDVLCRNEPGSAGHGWGWFGWGWFGGGGQQGYLKYASQFVSTDNAQVDGDQVAINTPATGTLTGWQITQGTQVHTDQIVGRIQILSTGPQQLIKSPGTGTVAVTNSVEGQYVTAGTNLATAYNFNDIYVTARVDETDIEAVHVGATADISADAYPGSPITGTVEEIQDGAATNFSDFPQDNSARQHSMLSIAGPSSGAARARGEARLVGSRARAVLGRRWAAVLGARLYLAAHHVEHEHRFVDRDPLVDPAAEVAAGVRVLGLALLKLCR